MLYRSLEATICPLWCLSDYIKVTLNLGIDNHPGTLWRITSRWNLLPPYHATSSLSVKSYCPLGASGASLSLQNGLDKRSNAVWFLLATKHNLNYFHQRQSPELYLQCLPLSRSICYIWKKCARNVNGKSHCIGMLEVSLKITVATAKLSCGS